MAKNSKTVRTYRKCGLLVIPLLLIAIVALALASGHSAAQPAFAAGQVFFVNTQATPQQGVDNASVEVTTTADPPVVAATATTGTSGKATLGSLTFGTPYKVKATFENLSSVSTAFTCCVGSQIKLTLTCPSSGGGEVVEAAGGPSCPGGSVGVIAELPDVAGAAPLEAGGGGNAGLVAGIVAAAAAVALGGGAWYARRRFSRS